MADRDRIRVLTYSLRHLRGDPAAVARVVRAVSPDVACLQQLPQHPLSGHRIGALAMACGLLWSGGGEPTGGAAVLTSLRLDQLRTHGGRLPVRRRLARSRGYASATVAVPAGPALTVASVQLGPVPDERVGDAGLILQGLRAAGPGPYVVAGDLGEAPGGPAWQSLAALVRAPAPDGSAIRDIEGRVAVLVSPQVVVESLRIAGRDDGIDPADLAAATDHLPVVADLRLPR